MENFIYRLDGDGIFLRYNSGIIDHPKKELHDCHEIYFLFEGKVELICELGKRELAPNTAVVIPKEVFHQFRFADGLRYVRCNIKFGELPQFGDLLHQKVNTLFTLQSKSITSVFQRMQALQELDKSDEEKKILLTAYLLEIIALLPTRTDEPQPDLAALSQVTRGAIRYIDEHTGGELSLSRIAGELYVSPSQLSHAFKRDMGCSLHRYILCKRLTHAGVLIRGGLGALEAAEQCGFHDYSNFYVQYKKHFGIPPSRTALLQSHPEDVDII